MRALMSRILRVIDFRHECQYCDKKLWVLSVCHDCFFHQPGPSDDDE